MLTSRENKTVKAINKYLANNKNNSDLVWYEYAIACSNRPDRYGDYSKQSVLCDVYDKYGDNDMGCSKAVHFSVKDLRSKAYGVEFEHIVIKRMQEWAIESLGNQVIDEIRFWKRYEKDECISDAFCPILAYHMTRSDRVTDMSEKGKNGAIIIAQKAVKICYMAKACEVAEEMNRKEGYTGTDAETRKEFLTSVCNEVGLWDVVKNPNGGNCGVIFDYYRNCYKAVIIDYAL